MSIIKISEEEKEEIRKQHRAATKDVRDRQSAEKGGPQIPEKKVEKKIEKKEEKH